MLNGIVLLTGATGFIGGTLVDRLSQHYTVVALDRPEPPDPPDPAQAVDFDLTSDEQVNAKRLADDSSASSTATKTGCC